MWELDHKESWAPKNWCFRTVMSEKTLRVPWTARRSNQSILKEISPEYSLEGMMLKLPTFWPPDAKSQLVGKDPDAGKEWRQEEKGTTEDEMVWRPYQLNGHEFQQTQGDSKGQGRLVCCSPWCLKELDTTKWLKHKAHITGNKGKTVIIEWMKVQFLE